VFRDSQDLSDIILVTYSAIIIYIVYYLRARADSHKMPRRA
jgi:hypothetical protein